MKEVRAQGIINGGFASGWWEKEEPEAVDTMNIADEAQVRASMAMAEKNEEDDWKFRRKSRKKFALIPDWGNKNLLWRIEICYWINCAYKTVYIHLP